MKRCAQCHGKLGLGVRSGNLWNGRWWVHVRYCSTHCEARHEAFLCRPLGTPITLRQGAQVIEDSRRLRVVAPVA
jgi:hypothetical protein